MYTSTTYTDPVGRVGEMPAAKSLYRREFDEMENRIRKCERERAELERKFADLMRERAECERATARAMKQRYKRIAEAERQRAERNESILRMLNKVDQQAASLAAKTDRLKMLKTQYEMYLMRTWSSTTPSYHTATPMAAIMAPPSVAPAILTPSSRAAPKSEFVQYLSDLTHQQTASVHPIPPPTALSNYLAASQKSYPLNTTGYGIKDDYLPTRMNTERSITLLGDGGEAPDRTKAKRFEMSNEDFIRYIDTEVLKEPAPIPTVNVQAPPSPEVAPKLEQKTATAYLEDVTVSEDEQQTREPGGGVNDPLDQFSIIMDQAANTDDKPVSGVDRVEETLPKTASEVEKETEDHQKPKENLESYDKTGVTKESDVITEYPSMEPNIPESAKNYEATGDTIAQKHDSSSHLYPDEPLQKSEKDAPVEPEYRAPTAVTFSEETLNYPPEQEEHQVYQQQPGYAEDYVSSEGYYNETQPESAYAMGAESSAYGETTQPYATDQYYNQEQMYDTLPASSVPPAESQPPPAAGNPHWGMARQAMRARTFPTVKSKPPSPEMQSKMPPAAYESVDAAVTETPRVEQTQSEYTEQVVSEEEAGGVYAPYSEQPLQDSEQLTAQDHEASMAQQYHQEDGQSAAQYQEGQYDASQSGDTHQATSGPPYQYQSSEGSAYQEGQYSADPGSTDQTSYQYQEGVDQSMANEYTAGDAAYGDPNQQYQYDTQNAQYYSEQQQQQQQGYEGQYYSEDQQQQQQYYMEDPNQQQGDPGQYEAQQPAEGYMAGQEYYAAPDEQQYQVEQPQPPSAEPDTSRPVRSDEVADTAQEPSAAQSTTDVVPPQTVDPVVAASKPAEPAVDKKTESSKPSAAQQPPGAKGSAPATQVPANDSPIVSSANDESDFDFSTQ
ncbi:uncharacterized protein LOC126573008 [Anopheles aquasalis]|uniref:uncharacterized protein LOC126573008 n=1 Tax=Anopheles aquasalis TaxID=42839 RepID=UPI00215A7188|nr:uncharacterized protein LOC126573008 [Anopheles aquasalis]